MGNIAHLSECRRKSKQIKAPTQALVILGLPRKTVYRRYEDYSVKQRRVAKSHSFWQRPAAELWHLLEAAKHAYAQLVKRHHPDRGGQAWRFHRIAEAWAFLKRHALRHGFSVL